MRLKMPEFRDLRSERLYRDPIIDEETEKEVGYLTTEFVVEHGSSYRHIDLFGGKYTITTESHGKEGQGDCYYFMKGVEAVLNHMTSTSSEAK